MSRVSAEEAIAARLEAFVRREGNVADDDPGFSREADVFGSGYLDSLGTVHLLAFLENEFHIVLEDDELVDPSFVSIVGMSRIVGAALRSRRDSPSTL